MCRPDQTYQFAPEPEREPTGPIDFRRGKRIWGPNTYTFPHAGAWINAHNRRRRPVQRRVVKRYKS